MIPSDKPPVPLRRWLWRSYVRAAIIPLLVVELSFLLIYWVSNTIVYRENIAATGELSHAFLEDVARREANAIGAALSGYEAKSRIFAQQALRALQGNHQTSAKERQRYAFDPDGSIYTRYDNGTTASYYSNIARPGPQDLERVLKLGAIDPLMKDIKTSSSDIISLYFNTYDSYNRIYPYIDAATQYPRGMDIASHNFYYQADARNNPARKPVWTDAYIDPAGHGWMVSAIAPVWNGNKLEGVVGIDIGLQAVIDRLMRLSLPWNAYAILVDRDGRIIAMPPAGERDFGLRELTSHSYATAIVKDSFKPDAFNINRRPDTRPLAAAMARAPQGDAMLTTKGRHRVSFATIPGPGWRLLVIASSDQINAPADRLRHRLELVSFAMVGGLLLFYVGFFVVLYRRARDMSGRVARPLHEISALMNRIGAGQYRQEFNGAQVQELDELGRDLVAMGERMGSAHDQIVHQEKILRTALERQQQANEQQARLVRVMSHELRTPLALIDSGAQILDRKADVSPPEEVRRRAGRMREAVRRIAEMLDKLVGSLSADSMDAATGATATQWINLSELVQQQATALVPAERLILDLAPDVEARTEPSAVIDALNVVLDNAVRYADPQSPITVRLHVADGEARIEVEDTGPGMADDEIGEVGKLFFRGRNTAGSTGAGVSLNLARRHLAESGGRLDLANAQNGLRATIALPRGPEGEGE